MSRCILINITLLKWLNFIYPIGDGFGKITRFYIVGKITNIKIDDKILKRANAR